MKTAAVMKHAGIYIATSVNEQFGLPALEAMAAGCLVISVPVKGGMEYLKDGYNCLVVTPDEMPEKLQWITKPENLHVRNVMVQRAIATAFRYHYSQQWKHLLSIKDTELKGLLA